MSSSQVSVSGSKFYYTPTSCSAASFIIAHTLGLKGIALEQVDLGTHKTKTTGTDFYTINPKGNVPALVLADGTLLNESSAILQLFADQKPEANLAGAAGTVERYRVLNELSVVATEVHTTLGPLFGANDANKDVLVPRALKKLEYLEKTLKSQFIANNKFSIVDAYLYILLTWVAYFGKLGVSLDNFPNVKKYFEGIGALPNVQEALKAAHANLASL